MCVVQDEPLHPERELEHFDTAHKVDLHIVERTAFALQERNASLCTPYKYCAILASA
jgi:hypothetical protein